MAMPYPDLFTKFILATTLVWHSEMQGSILSYGSLIHSGKMLKK